MLAMEAHHKEVSAICGVRPFLFQVAATTLGLPWDRTRLACFPRRPAKPETPPWERTLLACFLRRTNPRERTRPAKVRTQRCLYRMTSHTNLAPVPVLYGCIRLVWVPLPGSSLSCLYWMPRHSIATTSRLFFGCITAVEMPSAPTLAPAL